MQHDHRVALAFVQIVQPQPIDLDEMRSEIVTRKCHVAAIDGVNRTAPLMRLKGEKPDDRRLTSILPV